ncbi:MAG: DUF72 domain-containing protein [bacterium]
MSQTYIGTSGWSYPNGPGKWSGVFYPKNVTGGNQLTYYAERFNAVEVNVTFYRFIPPNFTQKWINETPDGFQFAFKLNKAFTHPGLMDKNSDTAGKQEVRATLEALAPAKQADKLGPLLIQFPASFQATEKNVKHLQAVLDLFPSIRKAVELRHNSWNTIEKNLTKIIAGTNTALVQIDEPTFPNSIKPFEINYDFAYFRLHGRNAKDWWNPKSPEDRYNYLYSDKELRPIARNVLERRKKGKDVYLFANNHFGGKAVANSIHLQKLLGQPNQAGFSLEFTKNFPGLEIKTDQKQKKLI